jgi:hypothetical protein
MACWRAAQGLRRWLNRRGTRMSAMHTLWPIWVIALVFALAGRNESANILAALPWWHRAMGSIAAVAFYARYLWRLIGH